MRIVAHLARFFRRPWAIPVVCGLVGLGYGILDWGYLDRLPPSAPVALTWLDEFVDLVWPVLFGAGIGIGVNLLIRQARLNRQLSVENLQLERHLMTNVLISQLLHDIRNPIHNLAAALEDVSEPLEPLRQQLLRRNIEQLEQVVGRLSRWGAVYDTVDPSEPVAFEPWLHHFIEDQARPRFRQLGVQYAQQVEPLTVRLHPLLLEQVFVTLITNACDALAQADGPRRISVSAHPRADSVEICVANTGSLFPQEVLASQGRTSVRSHDGLGLGLLLVRKMLEQVGGTLALENHDGQAVVTLVLPGQQEVAA